MKPWFRSALVQQGCDVVFLDSLLWLVCLLTQGTVGSLGLLPWLLLSLAGVALNRLLAGRGLTLAVLAGVNCGLFLLQAVVLFGRFSTLGGVMAVTLGFCFLVYTVGDGLYLILTPVTQKRALLAMERTVLACAAVLLAKLRFVLPDLWVGALLLSGAVCLLELLLMRMEGGLGQSRSSLWGGALVILAALGLIAGVMALLRLVLIPLGNSLMTAASGAQGVLYLVYSAFAWLKSLLDRAGGLFAIPDLETSGETVVGAVPEGPAGPSRWNFTFGEGGSPWLTGAFLLAGVGVLVWLAVVLLRNARGKRVKAPGSAAPTAEVVRSSPAGGGRLLGLVWARLVFGVRYCLLLVFRRGTPQGVLALLRLRRRPRKGETLRAYLLRLGGKAPEDSRWLFERLADELDGLYYGGSDERLLSPRELSMLRRASLFSASLSGKPSDPRQADSAQS